MGEPATDLQSVGLPPGLWQLVRERLALALSGLGLEATFAAVQIAADDLPGDDTAWYRLVQTGARPSLILTCHADVFCNRRHLQTTVLPTQAIWEQMEAPLAPQLPADTTYSAPRTDIFLHHHLLTICDLRAGRLQGREVPRHLLPGFGAAWAVTVDGRLAQRQLPGYPMAERRSRFSRLFSMGGILLPDHWQIFQALWDGGLADQAAILGATRRLPRL